MQVNFWSVSFSVCMSVCPVLLRDSRFNDTISLSPSCAVCALHACIWHTIDVHMWTAILRYAGENWGLSTLCRSIFGPSTLRRSIFGVCPRYAGQFLRSVYATRVKFGGLSTLHRRNLGSVCALQVKIWAHPGYAGEILGPSTLCRSFFLCLPTLHRWNLGSVYALEAKCGSNDKTGGRGVLGRGMFWICIHTVPTIY